MAEELFVSFRVPGEAQPAGSKNSYVPLHPTLKLPYYKGAAKCGRCHGRSSVERCTKCNARIIVNTVDSCKKSGAWKSFVHACAKQAMRAKFLKVLDLNTEGRTTLTPIRLIARFYQKRPGTHYRSGKFSALLKDDAPEHPTNVPDVLKLTRAIEDGMEGAIYKNDCAIVRHTVSKAYGREDRVDIEIWRIL